jgi:RNA polymerase sigma-70 factor (ECF subfamily)
MGPMQLTDEHIVKIREGSVTGFRLLYDSLFPSLVLFTSRYVDDREAVADYIQEAMFAYWTRRSEFSEVINVKLFIYGALKNMSLNYNRDKKIHDRFIQISLEEAISDPELMIQDDELTDQVVLEEEVYALLINAMQKLSGRQRDIMERSLAGEKNQEIADALGLSLNTVKTLKIRAFRHLRDRLRGNNSPTGRAAFSILICMM